MTKKDSTTNMSVGEAVALAEASLRQLGVCERDAHITAVHLVAAEVRGYPGHGLRRLLQIRSQAKSQEGFSENRLLVMRPGFMLWDGRGRLGIPAVNDALAQVTARLNEYASYVVGIHGYMGTTGSLGVYGSTLADQGVASVMICNSGCTVAPFGSTKAVLGTNPIAITIPGETHHFIGDVATSAWSFGAIQNAIVAQQSIPVGVVQTAEGKDTTDPENVRSGSQLPMAGHKGYALGLAVELLSGALIGAKVGRNAVPGSHGFLGFLIRADVARPARELHSDMAKLFCEILSGPLTPGHVNIRIPGERSSVRQKNTVSLKLPSTLVEQLKSERANHPGSPGQTGAKPGATDNAQRSRHLELAEHAQCKSSPNG